jgi:AbrB family looped-hinge helix DNA binding protein
MGLLQNQRVTIDAKGRVVLPRSIRDAAGLSAGSGLVASVEEDGAIRLEKVSARISRMQDRFARYSVPGTLASEEVIVERRQAAERE